MQKLLTFFFSKNISIYAIFNDQSFNDTLTNDIVSFEQLGPDQTPKNAVSDQILQCLQILQPLFSRNIFNHTAWHT